MTKVIMRQREKIGIFKQIESGFERFGLPGKECLLRFLCELYERPIACGLLGEAVNIIFRPSFSEGEENLLEEYKELLKAENHGKYEGNCQQKYHRCQVSIFELFSFLDIHF
ncbi:UNVERIFIED_CONTAM: hypothetical protein RMT77_011279 [Armadillidium vulgare]